MKIVSLKIKMQQSGALENKHFSFNDKLPSEDDKF